MQLCAFQRTGDHVDEHGRLTGDGPSTGYRASLHVRRASRCTTSDGVELVPDGEIGELSIQSDHLMSGYWQMPEQAADVLRDGWLRSGDLARRHAGLFISPGGVGDAHQRRLQHLSRRDRAVPR